MGIGTALTHSATKLLLLGSGELGKEIAIEAQRLGVEVIAVDRYANAPAMHVAHRSHVVDMLNATALRAIIESERPDFIVPEVEAINTELLQKLEQEGFNVVPTALATRLTMDREGIRRLAAEELNLPTSNYRFANTKSEYLDAAMRIGLPFVVKPLMSSSGKGQVIVKNPLDIDQAWDYAQKGGRAGQSKVILESMVDFDYEITLLTVRHKGGTAFCAPIGHFQQEGDYRQSWQPQPMSEKALQSAQQIAEKITHALGGYGVFGVEFFIKNEIAIFSEVSPRPHDTGMVTLVSQNLSEFALHVRALLGLPIPSICQLGFAASSAILLEGKSQAPYFSGIEKALTEENTYIRLFAKPEIEGKRRMGVTLALGDNLQSAIVKSKKAADAITLRT